MDILDGMVFKEFGMPSDARKEFLFQRLSVSIVCEVHRDIDGSDIWNSDFYFV